MDYLVLLSVAFLLFSPARSASVCVPEAVDGVSLDSNFELKWNPNPAGCNIDEYLVDVHDTEEEFVMTYIVNETQLDLSSLEWCKKYTFVITAVTTDHIKGASMSAEIPTKLPKDANLGLTLSSSVSSDVGIYFSWTLVDPSVAKCVSSYKITYQSDEDQLPTIEVVTSTNYTISDVISCLDYTFKVNAIAENSEAISIESESTVRAPPTSPPSVPLFDQEVPASDNVQLWFTAPSYEKYRCTFTLIVETIREEDSFLQRDSTEVADSSNRDTTVYIIIKNLEPNTDYNATFWFENEAGTSKEVTKKLATTAVGK